MIGIPDTDLQLLLETGPVAASHPSDLSLSAFRSERHALTLATQHLGFAAEHLFKEFPKKKKKVSAPAMHADECKKH